MDKLHDLVFYKIKWIDNINYWFDQYKVCIQVQW